MTTSVVFLGIFPDGADARLVGPTHDLHCIDARRLAMQRSSNPYSTFKNDQERRRALVVRECCRTVAIVVIALSAVPSMWMERFPWLMSLFR